MGPEEVEIGKCKPKTLHGFLGKQRLRVRMLMEGGKGEK
jgi:hypothetical protein